MKIVINTCFGGFSLPTEFCKKYNMKAYDDIERTDERLVSFVESRGRIREGCSMLVVKEIPDNATDYMITEYDGAEGIIYVVDGKLEEI